MSAYSQSEVCWMSLCCAVWDRVWCYTRYMVGIHHTGDFYFSFYLFTKCPVQWRSRFCLHTSSFQFHPWGPRCNIRFPSPALTKGASTSLQRILLCRDQQNTFCSNVCLNDGVQTGVTQPNLINCSLWSITDIIPLRLDTPAWCREREQRARVCKEESLIYVQCAPRCILANDSIFIGVCV